MSKIAASYPVDRYLVDSSKKFEMVNIVDDDLWSTDPALKPEEELILRKLHEMLQSTADDLKLLSGELSKFHQPYIQVKIEPTPLDDEFNDKVHIEEIVNAKFHGHKTINKSSPGLSEFKPSNISNEIKRNTNKPNLKISNTNSQMNTTTLDNKLINRNLGITRTKIIEINGKPDMRKTEKLNNGKVINASAVAYNEYCYKYTEPKVDTVRRDLKVQEMPRINIRSELKQQKVLQLDIMPDAKETIKTNSLIKNVAVIALQHQTLVPAPATNYTVMPSFEPCYQTTRPIRKISKMSTCDSSGSTNNASSETQSKLKTQKRVGIAIKLPQNPSRPDRKKMSPKKKPLHFNLEEWRNKLKGVYGSSTSKNNRPTTKGNARILPKKTSAPINNKHCTTNNTIYIPYSKLTIGGVNASDIEKEISEIPNKNSVPLTPIVNKILNSRENSFRANRVHEGRPSSSLKILSTSDENLLQEVIDIEKTVSETLSKNLKSDASDLKPQDGLCNREEAKEIESYVDDFEEEKSDHSGESGNQKTNISSEGTNSEYNYSSDNDDIQEKQPHGPVPQPSSSNVDVHNLTYTKTSNLAFKHKIDIFEFVHAVDTQESGTQSNETQKIIPKETQTSPRSDTNVQPIHNDLWSSMDPNRSVEKMFQLEKEFIKKLIVEEYGDVLEKNINKASSSKELEPTNNVAALQKNTQTSPAHMKNVMTSPTKIKTRTTSPITTLNVNRHTSPLIFVSNNDAMKIKIDDEDLAISVNLSSPRFNLRLPRNSQEVFSNLGDSEIKHDAECGREAQKSVNSASRFVLSGKRSILDRGKSNLNITTSSSSIEVDSSEISSLGEVKLKRMFDKMKITSDCESVCSSSSKYSSDMHSGILPLRSEGEMSLGLNKKSSKHSKSDGEASFGFL